MGATVNPNYGKLAAGYLFPEIARRTNEFQTVHPSATVMKLGIGNTTLPLTHRIASGLAGGVSALTDPETYTGYGDEQGMIGLRRAIAEQYKSRGVEIDPLETFVSDGAKPDSANVQSIFGLDNVVAVQDPGYPVYVDTNVIAGRSSGFDNETGRYRGFTYMPCTEENGFFPDVPRQKADLIYLCSPNNPTGAVATRKQLKGMVDFARENKSAIIFDAAYSAFVSDDELPRSIYEVEGAEECAIEINSFSKSAGFTGVRLGWTTVPKKMVVEGTKPGEVNALWNRRQSTFFNGPSNIVQAGGLAILSKDGQEECQKLVDYYMANASMIKTGLEDMGLTVYGGENAPYVWMKTPNGMGSWDFFDKLLNEAHVVGTPGAGFGPSGEGFFRLSAFGSREGTGRAVKSIEDNLRM